MMSLYLLVASMELGEISLRRRDRDAPGGDKAKCVINILTKYLPGRTVVPITVFEGCLMSRRLRFRLNRDYVARIELTGV